jgi:hypothetical protein
VQRDKIADKNWRRFLEAFPRHRSRNLAHRLGARPIAAEIHSGGWRGSTDATQGAIETPVRESTDGNVHRLRFGIANPHR